MGEEIFLLDGAFIKSCLNFPPYWMSQVIKLNIPRGRPCFSPTRERERERKGSCKSDAHVFDASAL